MKFYNFHHSFEDLVPPSVYYDEHPEYFSLVEGQRLRERSQLCLTNPNVKRIATQQVMKWIEDHPDCRVFSVAQNDWYNYCQCPECAAIDQREESPAGTMLSFVNDIANAVFQKHPDVLLHTFAYQYTRKAPKTLRPRDNVIVRLCTIECCFSHPLNGKLKPGQKVAPLKNAHLQCAALGEPVFLQDLRAWSQITHRLYVWDYVTDFAHYLLPFPNFDVLQANIQLCHQMGVKGLLEQGNFSHGGGGHFAELQAYLQAKLMWNPNCDMAYHIKDFVQGFYGTQACDCILEYIACLQKAIGPYHLSIGASPQEAFLAEEILIQADELLNQAFYLAEKVRDKEHIQQLQLGLTYALLHQMPVETPGRAVLVNRFAWQLRSHHISEVTERWPLESSLAFLQKHMNGEPMEEVIRADYKM